MIDDREKSRHKGRPVNLYLFRGIEPSLENLARSITISPGASEFGLGTTHVKETSTGRMLNQISQQPLSDFEHAIDDLLVCLPNLQHVSLMVSWYGNSLKIGECQIHPKIERPAADRETTPYSWRVGSVTRTTAPLVAQETVDGESVPMLGGTPSDRSVYEAILYLKSKGLSVTVYPLLAMDTVQQAGVAEPLEIVNPGAESGLTGWTVYPGMMMTVSTSSPAPYSGSAYFSGTTDPFGSSAMYQDVLINPVSEETTDYISVTLKYKAYAPSGLFPDVYVIAYDADGTEQGGFAGPPAPISELSDGWFQFETTAFVGAVVRRLRLSLGLFPKTSSIPNYVDDFELIAQVVYLGEGIPDFPWRGRININPVDIDQTSDAETQVQAFFGSVGPSSFSWNSSGKYVNYSGPADEWSYRRFILHLATIASAAGADDFIVGSEMVAMNRVRSDASSFPAIPLWNDLVSDVRTKVGSGINITYAAHHSEYHSFQPTPEDIFFPLDGLWSNDDINYIGINAYFPLGDWRDGEHLDQEAGHLSEYQKNYIQTNIEGGEGYDWKYESDADRDVQSRSLIVDADYGEHWIYRPKDFRSWWENEHTVRVGGVKELLPTAWVPESKKIAFTEIGIPAVHRATNDPDAVLDQRSSDSAAPPYSNERPDAAIQRAALEAELLYWRDNAGDMLDLDRVSLHTWDARPYPTYPDRTEFFADGYKWLKGYWLNGRLRPGFGFEAGEFGPYAFNDGEEPIIRDGITYQPFPISMSDITSSGDLDKSDITVTLARGSEAFESEFIGFPVSQVINLLVFHGHTNDPVTLADYPAIWVGRVGAPAFDEDSISFNCVPVSTSIQRPGLRRNYQLSCPHALYMSQCRANKVAATVGRVVTAISANTITFDSDLPLPGIKYRGGLLEWTASGRSAIRTIIAVDEVERTISIRGNLRGLAVGDTLKITLGCNRLQSDCSELHNNILNFGGQPQIPLENPLSQKNVFY